MFVRNDRHALSIFYVFSTIETFLYRSLCMVHYTSVYTSRNLQTYRQVEQNAHPGSVDWH